MLQMISLGEIGAFRSGQRRRRAVAASAHGVYEEQSALLKELAMALFKLRFLAPAGALVLAGVLSAATSASTTPTALAAQVKNCLERTIVKGASLSGVNPSLTGKARLLNRGDRPPFHTWRASKAAARHLPEPRNRIITSSQPPSCARQQAPSRAP